MQKGFWHEPKSIRAISEMMEHCFGTRSWYNTHWHVLSTFNVALLVLDKHKPRAKLMMHQANGCLGFQSTHFKAWSGMEKKDEIQIRLSS